MFISMFFGLKAMCYGLILNSCIDLYFSTYYTKKILGFSLSQQLKNVFPYLLVSLVILAEALLSSWFIPNRLLSLLVSVIACAGTYLLLAKALKLYAYSESMTLLGTLRNKKAA